MLRRIKTLLLASLLTLAISGCDSRSLPPGIIAPTEPLQQTLDQPTYVVRDDLLIQLVATFEAEALVLSSKKYRFGRAARLSPVDLALGWGPMSDQNVLEHISITQFKRFYWWRARQMPISRRDIERHSANMHMIPATKDVERTLRRLGRGDVVRFTGYLVNASSQDGWSWRTSLTRDDTGNGACELVLVNTIEAVDPAG